MTVPHLSSNSAVPAQLDDDRRLTESLTGVTTPQTYANWKEALREKHGFDYSVDYSATVMGATNTLNEEDSFAGGVVRFFGQWDLVGRDFGNTGSFDQPLLEAESESGANRNHRGFYRYNRLD